MRSPPSRPRHEPRALRALREFNRGLLALALAVGDVAGVGALAFSWPIRTFTLLLSGHADYSAVGHAANPQLPWLGRFFVLLAPVVAGAPLLGHFRTVRAHMQQQSR